MLQRSGRLTQPARPERVFPEEDEEFSATLKAVRYAHALRGFDESNQPVTAAAVTGNGDAKHYYYLV